MTNIIYWATISFALIGLYVTIGIAVTIWDYYSWPRSESQYMYFDFTSGMLWLPLLLILLLMLLGDLYLYLHKNYFSGWVTTKRNTE